MNVALIAQQACAWTPNRAQTSIHGSVGSVGSVGPVGSVGLVDNESASYLPISLRSKPVATYSACSFNYYVLWY